MKNIFITLSLILLAASILVNDAFAQSFYTGKVGTTLSGAGRIRLYSDSLTTKQIERASIIVGTGIETVFTYNEDADNVIPAVNVSQPQQSDFEIVGTADNSYLSLPPDVSSRANVYGWINGSFILIKYTIVNRESFEINAFIGMETIAEIDNSAGLETVEYLPAQNIVSFYRLPSSSYTGCKILSSNIFSSRIFDWTSDYDTSDSFLYSLLTSGTIDTLYDSQGDGAVSIYNQNSISIPADDSTEFWVAISNGIDKLNMIGNMIEAESKYQTITSVESDLNTIPSEFILEQNYPNPFNPSTKISFGLPQRSNIVLKVFNTLGEQVAELVNESLEAGTHSYNFDASNLTSGIYIYSMQTDAGVISKKMTLVK